MQYLSPPDSPTSELEAEDAGAGPPGESAQSRGRQLTEAQEHYSKQHADWLPQPLKSELSIGASPPSAKVSGAPTTASARKSRFGLLVPASPAFVAGGSLHSTSTQNKAVLLPPTLSASPSSNSKTASASSSPSGASSSLSSPAASTTGTAASPATGSAGAAGPTGPGVSAGSSAAAGKTSGVPAAPQPPLNIDSRTGLNAAKTRVLGAAGGLAGSGVVKTLENSSTSAAAGALVAAAFGRGAAVTGSTPQSARFAAAAAAAEAAARAAAAGRTEKGLPPDALVDGLPVQNFSHLRVMKEGTCVEVFCLPLLFQQARSTGRLILGRAEAADIPTEHPSCSRLHCELRRAPVAAQNSASAGSGGGGATNSNTSKRFTYTLKDLGSGHGTLINGGRVAAGKDTVLEDEDEIQLGFSQRLYLFFTGKDTFGPDPPAPSQQAPQAKESSPSHQQSPPPHSGPRGRPPAGRGDFCAPPPTSPRPPPPSTPPPPVPPPPPADDESATRQQQRHLGDGAGAGAGGDSTMWGRRSERDQRSSDPRWIAYQQHMERLQQQGMASSMNRNTLSYCLPATPADAEQAMFLQEQQRAFMQQQQQQEAYTEDGGSSDRTGYLTASAETLGGGGGGGAEGWTWEAAQQQQQLLYWQQQQQQQEQRPQQQQGLGANVGWEAGEQEQMWNAAELREHAAQQYTAEQYAQCWDAAAVEQQQQCAVWHPQSQQQQQPTDENYYMQQRQSGWSQESCQQAAEGEQFDAFQQCDDRQLSQQGLGHTQSTSAVVEGRGNRNNPRGMGGRDARGATVAAAAGGGGGSPGSGGPPPPFKRRASTAAARKLLWQHAGKKQQGDETSAAAAPGDEAATAAADGSGNKRLRLDGSKAALPARGVVDGSGTSTVGTRDSLGAAASTEATSRSVGGVVGLSATATGGGSSTVLQGSPGGAGSLYGPSSSSLKATGAAAAAAARQMSCSSSSSSGSPSTCVEGHAGSVEEENSSHRAFCAHILLLFLRRTDVEPWKGSSNATKNSNGVLLGRGGRVVTRSRSDALSSLKSVKDITADDPTQFGEFAAELSDCPSSKKRGVLGWVHAGQPGGRPPTAQQQEQTSKGSNSHSSKTTGKEQQHPIQRRTATEVAAQEAVDAPSENSSTSKSGEEKREEWWLPQEAVEAALQLQVGELSEVIESENGAHLLLRLK